MKRVEFLIAGTPIPKARPRVTRSGHTYTPKTTVEYEARIKEAAARAFPGGPISVPCRVRLCFVMPTRRRSDIDNLAKAFLDGAIGAAWVDDCQVNWIQAEKTYNKNMGCTAAVIEWEENENP